MQMKRRFHEIDHEIALKSSQAASLQDHARGGARAARERAENDPRAGADAAPAAGGTPKSAHLIWTSVFPNIKNEMFEKFIFSNGGNVYP